MHKNRNSRKTNPQPSHFTVGLTDVYMCPLTFSWRIWCSSSEMDFSLSICFSNHSSSLPATCKAFNITDINCAEYIQATTTTTTTSTNVTALSLSTKTYHIWLPESYIVSIIPGLCCLSDLHCDSFSIYKSQLISIRWQAQMAEIVRRKHYWKIMNTCNNNNHLTAVCPGQAR